MHFVSEPQTNYAGRLTEPTVFQGDAAQVLACLPSDFFRCCVNSPPYWGLRDYGEGGQIGAEDDPDSYVNRLVSVFEQVRRVLKEDGTFWLNIGDTYTSGNRATEGTGHRTRRTRCGPCPIAPRHRMGLNRKIWWGSHGDSRWPFSRPDGTSAVTSSGRNPTACPKALKTGPPDATGYVFLLSKSLHYYYDHEDIRETRGRNRSTVWSVPTEPFSDAHFATFPPRLIEPCILAGSKPGSCRCEEGVSLNRPILPYRPYRRTVLR